MFSDLKNLAAFNALANTATLHEAIATADAGASELLLQLSVADVEGDPVDAAARLVQEAARRAMSSMHTSEEPVPPEVHRALTEISEPNTRNSAIEQLLTWLSSRSEDAVE
jgi:hypothetical protein